MTTKKNTHSRRARRQRTHRIARVGADNWVLVLVSHTVATIVVVAVERLLNVPSR
jgi:hypothetical protein